MATEIFVLDNGFTKDATWHGLPNYEMTGEVITVGQIAETFNWTPVRVPYTYENPVTHELTVSEKGAGWVRSDNGFELSSMSATYGGMDYQETFLPFAEILISAGFDVETVGTLRNGARAFLSARIPEEHGDIDMAGWSNAFQVLNIGYSIDGSSPLQAAQALNVVVCSNTFKAHLLGMDSLFRIRSTKNGGIRRDAVYKLLEESLVESVSVRAQVERLVNDAYTEAQFREMLKHETVLGARPIVSDDNGNTKGQTHYDTRFDAIISRYDGKDIAEIRETKLGALMAVQGYDQHVSRVNKSASNPTASKAIKATESVLFGESKFLLAASELILATV